MDNRPYYHKLYADLIREKYPNKEQACCDYLKKEHWTALDVIQVNEVLFGSKKNRQDRKIDQQHRAYDSESIKQILLHQQKNRLSNIEVANKYGVSRNTISKWKRLFPDLCEADMH